jgi:hypothetical protein
VTPAADVATRQPIVGEPGYAGSRFSDVVAAIFANPYQQVWGTLGESPLPVYEVSYRTVLGGLAAVGLPGQFQRDSARALDSRADLIWGTARKGLRRLVHPNGVCLTGRWSIDQESEYTGYFRRGSSALMIGRYSTCCTDTRRGDTCDRRRSWASSFRRPTHPTSSRCPRRIS